MNKFEAYISSFFQSISQNDYYRLMDFLSDTVAIDFSSLNDVPKQELTRAEICEEIREFLPGFYDCKRNLEIGKVAIAEKRNLVECHSTVEYRLNKGDSDFWGLCGTYYFELVERGDNIKIESITFHLNKQVGDLDLPIEAWDRVHVGLIEPHSFSKRAS